MFLAAALVPLHNTALPEACETHEAPMQVCRAPNITLTRGFITPDEAAHLIEVACGKLRRAQVGETSADGAVGTARTSSSYYLSVMEQAHPLMAALRRRASQLSGLHVANFESLQVQRYEPCLLYTSPSPRDS